MGMIGWNMREKIKKERIGGVGKKVIGREGLGEEEIVKKEDKVWEVERKEDLMSEDKNSEEGIGKIKKEKKKLIEDIGIERGCRIIEKNKIRKNGKREWNGEEMIMKERKKGGKNMGIVEKEEKMKKGERMWLRLRKGEFMKIDREFKDVLKKDKMGKKIKMMEKEKNFRENEVDLMMRMNEKS